MTPTPIQNCPFYGHQMSFVAFGTVAFAPFNLIATHGNQCALITGAHSPCQLENIGQPVEWSVCPFVIGRLMVGSKER